MPDKPKMPRNPFESSNIRWKRVSAKNTPSISITPANSGSGIPKYLREQPSSDYLHELEHFQQHPSALKPPGAGRNYFSRDDWRHLIPKKVVNRYNRDVPSPADEDIRTLNRTLRSIPNHADRLKMVTEELASRANPNSAFYSAYDQERIDPKYRAGAERESFGWLDDPDIWNLIMSRPGEEAKLTPEHQREVANKSRRLARKGSPSDKLENLIIELQNRNKPLVNRMPTHGTHKLEEVVRETPPDDLLDYYRWLYGIANVDKMQQKARDIDENTPAWKKKIDKWIAGKTPAERYLDEARSDLPSRSFLHDALGRPRYDPEIEEAFRELIRRRVGSYTPPSAGVAIDTRKIRDVFKEDDKKPNLMGDDPVTETPTVLTDLTAAALANRLAGRGDIKNPYDSKTETPRWTEEFRNSPEFDELPEEVIQTKRELPDLVLTSPSGKEINPNWMGRIAEKYNLFPNDGDTPVAATKLLQTPEGLQFVKQLMGSSWSPSFSEPFEGYSVVNLPWDDYLISEIDPESLKRTGNKVTLTPEKIKALREKAKMLGIKIPPPHIRPTAGGQPWYEKIDRSKQ